MEKHSLHNLNNIAYLFQVVASPLEIQLSENKLNNLLYLSNVIYFQDYKSIFFQDVVTITSWGFQFPELSKILMAHNSMSTESRTTMSRNLDSISEEVKRFAFCVLKTFGEKSEEDLSEMVTHSRGHKFFLEAAYSARDVLSKTNGFEDILSMELQFPLFSVPEAIFMDIEGGEYMSDFQNITENSLYQRMVAKQCEYFTNNKNMG